MRLSAKLSELEEDEVKIVAEWTDYDEEMFRLGEQIPLAILSSFGGWILFWKQSSFFWVIYSDFNI